MESIIIVLGTIIGFGLGYPLGKAHGYLDARPERDNKGRFKKRG